MKDGLFYSVDANGQTIRIDVSAPAVQQKRIRRVLKDWAQGAILLFIFLALMIVGGAFDAWASASGPEEIEITSN